MTMSSNSRIRSLAGAACAIAVLVSGFVALAQNPPSVCSTPDPFVGRGECVNGRWLLNPAHDPIIQVSGVVYESTVSGRQPLAGVGIDFSREYPIVSAINDHRRRRALRRVRTSGKGDR